MVRTRVPLGQDLLPDMPPTPFLEVEPDARNSLAKALLPEFVGIRPEDYIDVTDEQLRLASPQLLRASLINVSRETHGAAANFDPEKRRTTFIATTPHEFGILTGSVQMLGERAVSRTELARQRSGNFNARDIAASRRSGVHEVESRLALMEKYVAKELLPEIALIDRFLEAAEHPGLARFSNQKNMRVQFTTLQTVTVGNIISALQRSRQWSPAQQQRATKAIDARMFLDRNDNRHLDYFKDMLLLAKERNDYLLAIARKRIAKSEQYARNNTPDVNQF